MCRGVGTAWCCGLDFLTYLLEADRSERFSEEVGRVVLCWYVFSSNLCAFDVVLERVVPYVHEFAWGRWGGNFLLLVWLIRCR